jgi:transposase-like protein
VFLSKSGIRRQSHVLSFRLFQSGAGNAIEAYQAGKGVAEIAKLLGVHWGSVSRWLTKWRRDGVDIALKPSVGAVSAYPDKAIVIAGR